MKTRVSNSNRLQRFLFWTNWIQLNQRLEFDWSTRRTQRKYFYLYIVQIFFELSLSFLSSRILLRSRSQWLYRDVCAEYILREHWNDVFECIKKNVINITRKTSSRKVLDRKKKFRLDVSFFLMIWCFDAQCLSMRWKQQRRKLELYDRKNSFYVEKNVFSSFSRSIIDDFNA